jgi:hypothetical protein
MLYVLSNGHQEYSCTEWCYSWYGILQDVVDQIYNLDYHLWRNFFLLFMDFDRIEYWDFKSEVHKDIGEQTSQTYHMFHLK